MTQGFFQFNNSIINEITDFATSTFDLLFITGPKGSSKSETLEKIIPEFESENLVFQHFCFENTEIDDFLLNFYDALRNFSLAQKISLKKFTSDNFKEKVSHYFKTINANCLIIVENFEKIDKNVEIIDFLSHLANYENVKIIIASRNSEQNLFAFKKIKVKTIMMEQIDKDEFKSKLTVLTQPLSQEIKDEFYEMTQGLELYLKMSAKYCSTTGVSIEDLIDEYKRKNSLTNIDYEEFIISKFISITPNVYKDLFKLLCTISHPVGLNFINEYKLGNTSYIDYLYKNYLVNKFKEEFYVKDYFKDYILKTFSIQEKITYYNNLINIYENELTKSPKDRLLRLSRESIRKEIERAKFLIPSINSAKNQKAFSYLGITTSNWKEEKEKTNLVDKLNKIKERKRELEQEKNPINYKKNNLLQDVQKEKNRRHIIKLINEARELMQNYQYNDAINELLEAQNSIDSEEFSIEILCLIAKNFESLNEFLTAQKYYNEALGIAIETRDSRKNEIEFSIALTNKYLFKIDGAKAQFKQIALDEKNSQIYRAKAFLELGEINQANSDINKAKENYKDAIDLSLGRNKELVCKGYYLLAVLYDENQDIENAVKYYQKNYTTSSEPKENKYYSASLTNLALIYEEQSQYKQALELLKLALIYDSENNDFENMYFSQKELGKLYLKNDEISAKGYFKQALESARLLNDSFKEALIYFEIGEYYYDKQDDKKALINFLNAKKALKGNISSENSQRIALRIKDIQFRLDENSFKTIMEEYEK